MEKITIVTIGPDQAEHLTLEAAELLKNTGMILLRTQKHGVAEWLSAMGVAYESLDACYEQANTFDELNQRAADHVLLLAKNEKNFCYAVPDPSTDATVAELKKRGVSLRIIPGMTQIGLLQKRLLENSISSFGRIGPEIGAQNGSPLSDAAASRLCILPSVDLSEDLLNPEYPMLILEVNSALLAGEVKLCLMSLYPPDFEILFSSRKIPLRELDRQKHYDHLTAVYIPACDYSERSRYNFADLLKIMRRLRAPVIGCPWDMEQTHQTLRQYLIEEAYEAVDAIGREDPWRVADELGDVLLQVVFHSQIAYEHSDFTINDVTTAICQKMISRHAHIFGGKQLSTAEDVVKSWERIKQKEKGIQRTADLMRDIPLHLPALMRAYKVQNKARQVGFDWEIPLTALEKVKEEVDEVASELTAQNDPGPELGDLLFAVVNTARLAGIQPELALGQAIDKFIGRFAKMESQILADGKQMQNMKLSEMDAHWDSVKRAEKETQ